MRKMGSPRAYEQGAALLFVKRACGGPTRRRGHGEAPEKKEREKGKGKGRSAAMHSASPAAHPCAIRHHTTNHHRDDTATAVPRVLSW